MDRRYRIPRMWSNQELRRIAPIFTGSVINVSAWRDEDKEGNKYRDYFVNASSYIISNYEGNRGATGQPGEIFLDLTQDLPQELCRAFDVVFNHTTLEHIYDVKTAVANLCAMSRQVVIVVVPFMQQSHGANPDYQDYWRFTPQALRWLFRENGFQTIYESASPYRRSSVYLFVVAARDPDKWNEKLTIQRLPSIGVGSQIIENYPLLDKVRRWLR